MYLCLYPNALVMASSLVNSKIFKNTHTHTIDIIQLNILERALKHRRRNQKQILTRQHPNSSIRNQEKKNPAKCLRTIEQLHGHSPRRLLHTTSGSILSWKENGRAQKLLEISEPPSKQNRKKRTERSSFVTCILSYK